MKQTPVESLERAVSLAGGQSALASQLTDLADRDLGPVSAARVWNWINRDLKAPGEFCPLIERATKGRVRCEDLRPDIAWHVVRSGSRMAAAAR